MVRMEGLEPPWLAPLVPKTSVSTISPHPLSIFIIKSDFFKSKVFFIKSGDNSFKFCKTQNKLYNKINLFNLKLNFNQ